MIRSPNHLFSKYFTLYISNPCISRSFSLGPIKFEITSLTVFPEFAQDQQCRQTPIYMNIKCMIQSRTVSEYTMYIHVNVRVNFKNSFKVAHDEIRLTFISLPLVSIGSRTAAPVAIREITPYVDIAR